MPTDTILTPQPETQPLVLRLRRLHLAPTHTAGTLCVAAYATADASPTTAGLFWRYLCDTLEPPRTDARGRENVPRLTCIPAGRYRLVTCHSPRFTPSLGCLVPALCDVPARTGILIHPGNGPADTEGCILVGRRPSGRPGRLEGSRTAFAAVQALVADAYARRRPAWLEVE